MVFKPDESNIVGSLWTTSYNYYNLYMIIQAYTDVMTTPMYQFVSLTENRTYKPITFGEISDFTKNSMIYAGNIKNLDIQSYLEEIKTNGVQDN